MKKDTVLDLLFEGRFDYAELRQLRIELGHKVYNNEAVATDNLRWQWVLACITGDYSKAPINTQLIVVFTMMHVHGVMRNIIERQWMQPDNVPEDFAELGTEAQAAKQKFISAYWGFFEYAITDFISSDPLKTAENLDKTIDMLREAWQTHNLARPWDSVATRCTISHARVRIKQPAKAKGKAAGAKRKQPN